MKALYPRHKRLERQVRLQVAKHWLPQYAGKNIVKGYSKYFGVDKVCAALELQMLAHKISVEYIEQLKDDAIGLQRLKEKKKREKELQHQEDMFKYSDEIFYFIAGYTSNGVPYGVACNKLQHEFTAFDEQIDSEGLPF